MPNPDLNPDSNARPQLTDAMTSGIGFDSAPAIGVGKSDVRRKFAAPESGRLDTRGKILKSEPREGGTELNISLRQPLFDPFRTSGYPLDAGRGDR